VALGQRMGILRLIPFRQVPAVLQRCRARHANTVAVSGPGLPAELVPRKTVVRNDVVEAYIEMLKCVAREAVGFEFLGLRGNSGAFGTEILMHLMSHLMRHNRV